MLHPIVTGIWTDWSDGSAVLTVAQQHGPLVVAVTALFVNLSIGQAWNIVRFLLHQGRCTPDPQTGLYHQIQALLRNMPTSGSALWSLATTAWAWRRAKDVGAVRESAGPLLAAVLHLCALTASGILSSQVVSAGDKVLVNGARCGWSANPIGSNDNATSKLDADIVAYEVGRKLATKSLRYAQLCYNATGAGEPGACNEGFFAPSLGLKTELIPCPFSKDLCALSDRRGSLRVDTGYIDSSEHLGINTRPDSRVRFRKVMSWTPILAEENFSSGVVRDPPEPNWFDSDDSFRYYYLGPTLAGPNKTWRNETWMINNYTFWGNPDAYRLNSLTAWAGYYDDLQQSRFSPIPALRAVQNADLTLLLLTNAALYPTPVHDPWFQARSHVDAFGYNLTVARANPNSTDSSPWDSPFAADRALSVLACTEQYQVCNTTHCGPLSGFYDKNMTANLDLDPVQQATFRLLLTAFNYVTFNYAVGVHGSSLLLARNRLITLTELVSSPLPPTQWLDEAANMAAAMLAAVQQRIVDFASPPDFAVTTAFSGTVRSLDYIQPPRTAGERELCRSVRVQGHAHYNFSVTGLAVILAVGLAIIVVNLACIPSAAFWARRRLRRHTAASDDRELEWYEGDLLVAQCRLFEKQGVGPWRADGKDGVGTPMPVQSGKRFKSVPDGNDVGSGERCADVKLATP
ncbi:hypothetical protein QBC34DRAFT_464390 [Podospora aff. communis PSN243]|uniref:Uncharacterized protein n=1 Tax=Podospora aff. communis PSN243 TaxID=3040156 RepID=A0AAV9GL70_9PEZI|nr:hypothetical protein QBC34DRAFT_464390 [Podospora aff. communis PSN243]